MIRLATADDLPQVGALYDAILDREAASGVTYTNWLKGTYPCLATARSIWEAGTLYVGVDDTSGRIWGAVNLNGSQLPEYDAIPWSIPAAREEVAVIHTLCIHPDAGRRGLGREMMVFCEEEARRQGKTAMRLDTWEGNVPANHLYPSLGYHLAGATEFFFQGYIHEVLNCYEKAL